MISLSSVRLVLISVTVVISVVLNSAGLAIINSVNKFIMFGNSSLIFAIDNEFIAATTL
jgi:hypothetical protein